MWQRLPWFNVATTATSGYSVSDKCNMNTFRGRKCSVSSEQVSVSRLYPFGLQQEEAALTRPFCPAWPPSCPGGGGSKSTHGWITHTCICTCTKCCPGVCVRRWLKYINSFKNGFSFTNSTVCFLSRVFFTLQPSASALAQLDVTSLSALPMLILDITAA